MWPHPDTLFVAYILWKLRRLYFILKISVSCKLNISVAMYVLVFFVKTGSFGILLPAWGDGPLLAAQACVCGTCRPRAPLFPCSVPWSGRPSAACAIARGPSFCSSLGSGGTRHRGMSAGLPPSSFHTSSWNAETEFRSSDPTERPEAAFPQSRLSKDRPASLILFS